MQVRAAGSRSAVRIRAASFAGSPGGGFAYELRVSRRGWVRKQRLAAHHEAEGGRQHPRRPDEFELPFFGSDPSDYADSVWPGAGRRNRIIDTAAIDDLHLTCSDERTQRLENK